MHLLELLYGDQKSRRLSYLFLLAGFVLFAFGMFSSLADSFGGTFLTYAGIFVLVLAHVHHWRSKRKFFILMLVSIIGIPVFKLLENIFETLAKQTSQNAYLSEMFNSFSALFFILAVLIFPAVLLIAIIGFIWSAIKNL